MKPEQEFSGFTPGPWKYNRCKCGHPVCDKFTISIAWAEGMFLEPDAKLIAAAPDLLAELQRLRRVNAGLLEALRRITNYNDLATAAEEAERAIAAAGEK